GVDRSVECTGSVQAMISAFEYVHDGWGVAILVGVPSKYDVFKTHPMNFLNERTLKGTFYGNYKSRTDLPNVVEKYMKGELELEKFITHTVSFPEINKPLFDAERRVHQLAFGSEFSCCFNCKSSCKGKKHAIKAEEEGTVVRSWPVIQ
ncbi:hypothetical protein S83_031641, partial [Arachis hypogaea]